MPKASPKPAPDRTRAERLEARVTAAQKALIQRAAELEGRSLTDYVIASVQEAAKRTLEAHETIVLSAADSRAFVDALLDPPPVNARLQDSVRRYREIIGV
jgi:uncharacterized protein (DUF1778 family)